MTPGISGKNAIQKNAFSFLPGSKALKAMYLMLRLGIAGITLWYLYAHIWLSKDFANSLVLLKSSLYGSKAIILLSISIGLIAINWGIEAMKWKILIGKFIPVSFSTAFKAILTGTSVSLWVPNRAGEYIGRVLFVPEGLRMKGIFATLAGSAAQLIVTLVLGCIGLLYYLGYVLGNYYLFSAAFLLFIVLSSVLFFMFFHIRKIRKFIPEYHWLKPVKKYARVYKYYSKQDLAKVLNLSFLRYLVFCSQYILLSWLFGIKVPLVDGFLLLFLIYLIQTAIPTTTLTELGVRGATAIFFFKAYTTNLTAIVAASYSLWFINLALPGVIGLVFLLMVKLGRKSSVSHSVNLQK